MNPEANEKYSKALFDHFHKTLGIPTDRGYMYAPFNVPQQFSLRLSDILVPTARSMIPETHTLGKYQ
jgi:hypothetical protein